MTSNDGQIDLLIRRFATRVPAPGDGAGHLDADELNAFAEGALPAAARARYVSHLAECDHCRRQVSDLAIASGAVVRVVEDIPQTHETKAWWATLGGLFSLPILRYAALAAVLLVVAGVAFVALRRRSEPTLVARNESLQEQPVSAVKPAADAGTGGGAGENTKAGRAPSVSQPAAPPAGVNSAPFDEQTKVDTTKTPATTAPAEPKELAANELEPMKKAEASRVQTQTQPSYAPAPPGESQSGGRFGQQQAQSGAGQSLGGAKMQQQADKSQAEYRERDRAKDARVDDSARQRENDAVLAQRRSADEKQKGGPSRNMDNSNLAMNNRNSNDAFRTEAPRKSDGTDEEAPQTRSVGGRKFARQGNRWVDQKFKSSMSLNHVSRGSDEFAALDSGLRSIAQQLGGEVIVVWKGKAYLFR